MPQVFLSVPTFKLFSQLICVLLPLAMLLQPLQTIRLLAGWPTQAITLFKLCKPTSNFARTLAGSTLAATAVAASVPSPQWLKDMSEEVKHNLALPAAAKWLYVFLVSLTILAI